MSTYPYDSTGLPIDHDHLVLVPKDVVIHGVYGPYYKIPYGLDPVVRVTL